MAFVEFVVLDVLPLEVLPVALEAGVGVFVVLELLVEFEVLTPVF